MTSVLVASVRVVGGGEKMLYTGPNVGRSFVTVEVAPKWYSLYLVEGDSAQIIDYEDLVSEVGDGVYGIVYLDHVPNPGAMVMYANNRGVGLSLIALGAVIQAWGDETGQWPRIVEAG